MTDTIPAARHETGSLEGAGGLKLFRQAWLPPGESRAAIVLIHGGAEHSGRYAWVGSQLAARDLALHAIDLRGHGRSEGGGGAYVDRMRNAVADVDALADHATAAHPGAPLFVLGHSMGGLIAILYALEHGERLRGLALSAPVAALRETPLALRIVARTLSVLAPRSGVFQIDAEGVSRDPQVVRDYDEDPLNHRGKLPARTLAEIADAVEGLHDAAPRLELPLLVMHSPADTIAAFAGGEMVHARASSPDKTLVRYDGLAHELLNEPEREQVLRELAEWVEARI